MGFRLLVLWSRVQGLRFRFLGLGLRVWEWGLEYGDGIACVTFLSIVLVHLVVPYKDICLVPWVRVCRYVMVLTCCSAI